MIVNEAVVLLKSSELKQLSVKDDPQAILGFINLGILEIHKRFLLWEADALITQKTDVLVYSLDGVDTNVVINLNDHSILMIEAVYDEEDEPYVINNDKDPCSIYTPRPHTIKIPEALDGYKMEVTYRASPKFLVNDTEEIPLPVQFIEALFLYVAYKAHTSIKSGQKDENNTHYVRFNASCNLINIKGLLPTKDLVSTKFEQRGFV